MTPLPAHDLAGRTYTLVGMADRTDCELPSPESLRDSHVRAILAQAERICALEPGWDGAHAPRVDASSATHAVRFAVGVTCPECLPPTITATASGNVLIDWTWADEHVEVEVFADGRIEALVKVGSERREFVSTATDENTLQWLAHQVTGVGISRLHPPN
jgi:hypothetical protein